MSPHIKEMILLEKENVISMLEPLKMRKNRLEKMLKKLLCYNKIVTTEELLSFIPSRGHFRKAGTSQGADTQKSRA